MSSEFRRAKLLGIESSIETTSLYVLQIKLNAAGVASHLMLPLFNHGFCCCRSAVLSTSHTGSALKPHLPL